MTPLPVLPIVQRRQEIEAAVRAHQVVVICGETGSGKTTQLPQFFFSMGLAARGRIAHTQPRRLAARAVAARIAEEMNVRLGELVGVKVRFQDQTSPATRIKLMTDGMLLAELAADPQLREYSLIIIDEAHERSLNIDFILGYLHRLLPARPDLKVVITSATIDPRRFSDHFGGPSVAPVIEVSGRTYPVEIRYHPPDPADDPTRVHPEHVADAAEELLRPSLPAGDVLVFLPGEREIRITEDALKRRNPNAEILPLLARLSADEQDRIFHPSGRRRVILATNVAETSLTVPGVRYVVDTGLARISRYDPERKVQRLPVEPVSRASANQRSGRCGRVADGIAIRLYDERSFIARSPFTAPEIQRTNLASVLLQMKSLSIGPIEEFPFLDPPDTRAIADACETLFELGAIAEPTSAADLTPVGRDLARLPVDPRIGRMLLAANHEGSLREAIILAAALSIQDPRERPMGRQDAADRGQLVFRNDSSDFLTLLNIWDQYSHAAQSFAHAALRDWCREHFLSASRMREWADTAHQLRDVARDIGLRENEAPATHDAIHRALLTGLISNVACRDGEAGSFDYRGVRGNVVSIFPGSALFRKAPKWIMAAEVVHTTRLYARTVARISVEWIEELAGHMLERRLSDRHLDPDTGEPSAWERVAINGIVVAPRRRVPISLLDPSAARKIFILEGLVQRKWKSEHPFVLAIAAVLDRARDAEARLRRRGLLRPDEEIAALIDAQLPPSVRDPESLANWVASNADSKSALSLEDILSETGLPALDEKAFPSSIQLGGRDCPLHYAMAPGKDEDGVTLDVGMVELAALSAERAEWLVPGMLPDLLAAMLKTLPKSVRATLETSHSLDQIATETAGVLDFGRGDPARALADAVETLYNVRVDPAAFSRKAIPNHLRMRIQVLDHTGKALAVDRDLAALRHRFDGRIRRAQAALARASFERDNLTFWDFTDLPDRIAVERDSETVDMFPTLVDQGSCVRLTLVDNSHDAARITERGVRRLFTLACAEEVNHRLVSMSEWTEMVRHYQQLGSSAQLKDHLAAQVAERAFLAGRNVPRSREQFEDRLQESWGRLAVATRDIVELAAAVLASRAAVAHRLASGTPRMWADSIADIREHAAYLMPVGFFNDVPGEYLRNYPRYAQAMRERLFGLREGGSNSEKAALQQFLPHWKRFTGWVAAAMNENKLVADEPVAPPVKSQKTKAPLPQTRRNSPTVNVDAGVWALAPGNLPPSVARFRWALEEARISIFTPHLAPRSSLSVPELDTLWKKIESGAR